MDVRHFDKLSNNFGCGSGKQLRNKRAVSRFIWNPGHFVERYDVYYLKDEEEQNC